MTSVSIITNRCGWSTSVNTVTSILNNKLILSSVWVSDCYCVASIWIFSSCCCCSFTVFTIFDDSVGNIAVSICNFNSMSSIVVIRYFNFRSLTVFTVFLTTVSLVEPSGFVTVIVWLPSGFSVVVIFAVLPSLPSLTTVVDSEPSGF